MNIFNVRDYNHAVLAVNNTSWFFLITGLLYLLSASFFSDLNLILLIIFFAIQFILSGSLLGYKQNKFASIFLIFSSGLFLLSTAYLIFLNSLFLPTIVVATILVFESLKAYFAIKYLYLQKEQNNPGVGNAALKKKVFKFFAWTASISLLLFSIVSLLGGLSSLK